MRLFGKSLLMLVATGVNQAEVAELKKKFEKEQASVLITIPHEHAIEVWDDAFVIDIPFEAVRCTDFDGLIIPDGHEAAVALAGNAGVRTLIHDFHQAGIPIFASGRAIEVLYESHVFPQQILVRDQQTTPVFVEQAVDVLLDAPLVMAPGSYGAAKLRRA
jgi:putative intracellular protease/amidase